FTVADRYAYITAASRDNLDAARRIAPSAILNAGDNALASLTVRVDRVPDLVKQLALQRIELQMADAKERKAPNETPAQAKFRVQAIDHVAQRFRSLLSDAQALELKVAVDGRADEVSAQFSLTPKPGTPLAGDLTNLAGRTSTFGGFRNLALQMAVNVAI